MIKESEYSVNSICVDTIIAFVLGVLAIVAIILAIVASYKYDGNGPAAVGLLGVASLVFGMSGLGFSRAAWKSADGGIIMKRVVFFENLVPFITALVFYILGWVS